jgi:hypothetical protein
VIRCLREGGVSGLESHRNAGSVEIAGTKGHSGAAAFIDIILFPDGDEGTAAAEKLDAEPAASGAGSRHVIAIDGGMVVAVLSNRPSAADEALAERCSES